MFIVIVPVKNDSSDIQFGGKQSSILFAEESIEPFVPALTTIREVSYLPVVSYLKFEYN